jgi:formylglycine-generating enzyme required for sulfatase activity
MFLALAATAQPVRRALLIANSKYQKLPQGPGLESDAAHIESALKDLKFVTTAASNLTYAQMRQVRDTFASSIRPGDEVFIYFAGVGMHSQQLGDNFLLTTDFDPARRDNAYSLTGFMQLMDEKGAANKVVFIDAARAGKELGEAAGLMLPLEPVAETMMVFAHQFEQVVAPGDEGPRPGAFARAIAGALQKPGLSLSGIAEDVIVETGNLSRGRLQPVTAMQRLSRISRYREPVVRETVRVIERPVEVIKPAGLEPGATRELKKAGLQFSWIPAGEFLMGCVPGDSDCAPNESPRHPVRITRDFWITKTEVTAKSYNEFSRATGAPMPKPTNTNKDWLLRANPVTRISWESAQAYCQWLGGRLPTEAEWEYAARAAVAGRIFPWGDKPDPDQANMFGKAKDKNKRDQWDEYTSAPIGSFDGNAWGLMDVSGNVREWVLDWYDPAWYKPQQVTDPKGPETSPVLSRVVRGGDFYSNVNALRLSAREFRKADDVDNRTGFRCVLPNWPAN